LITEDVAELLTLCAMIERGLPALPESGGWFDQSAQFCEAFEFVSAERSAVREELGLVKFGDGYVKTDDG